MKKEIIIWIIKEILAYIITAVVTITTAAIFVMHFNDADTLIGCLFVIIGWLVIMIIVTGIMFKITHKIFRL